MPQKAHANCHKTRYTVTTYLCKPCQNYFENKLLKCLSKQNKIKYRTLKLCCHCTSISGTRVTRTDLGLPENWLWIENWLNDFEDVVQEEQKDSPPIELKNREIPILSCYDNGASNEFWSAFPKNYNSKLQKTVKIKLLKN